MFNLKQAIAAWRRQMCVAGAEPSVLDELESHLREDVANLMLRGTLEQEAFEIASSRLGTPKLLVKEFEKVERTPGRAIIIGVTAWAAITAYLAVDLRPPNVKQLHGILYCHILILTSGYLGSLITGGLASYYVWLRRRGNLSLNGEKLLACAVLRSTQLSVALILAGVALGLYWSRRNLGGFFAGGAREFSPLLLLCWMVASGAAQLSGRIGRHGQMLVSVAGSMAVCIAWFAVMIADAVRFGHLGWIAGYMGLILAVMAVQAVFLGIGLSVRTSSMRPVRFGGGGGC